MSGAATGVRSPVIDTDLLEQPATGLHGEFEHELARFDGGDLTDLRGRGLLTESVLTNVDLTGSVLHPLTLTDVRLVRVELSGVALRQVVARRVELVRCRGLGLRLELRQVADLLVDGCRLDQATVRVEQVKGPVAFRECTFREATVAGNLSGVLFYDCDFTGAEFAVTIAKGCDLRSSRLVGARGLLTLRGATISADQAISVADQLAAEAGLRISTEGPPR